MPPKKAPSKRTTTRATSPRRRASASGNVAIAAEQRFAELMQECVQSAQRLAESSQTCTVRHQREVKKMLTLLHEAQEKRPTLLRSGRSPARGSASKS